MPLIFGTARIHGIYLDSSNPDCPNIENVAENLRSELDAPDSASLRECPSGFHAPPSSRELLFLVALSGCVMWITLFLLHGAGSAVFEWGDDSDYLIVADAIRHWDFHHIYIQHFMGYPYSIAAVSLLLHIPAIVALWLIAVLSSLASIWLAARLFGTVAAAYFALTNFAWLQVSFLGGSEPLCVALGLGALLAFRRHRVFLAALLASLSVIVRPLMIFVLAGIGIVLLSRRQFRSFFIALGTGLAIAAVYMLPLARSYGDPLLTVHSYTAHDYGGGGIKGPHGHLFGWPFHGIVAGTLDYPASWRNLLLSFFWIGLVLAGVAMMFSRRFREYAKTHPNEAIFCGLYLMAIFSYDYLLFARSNFIRFAIPGLPFVFFALLPVLPKDRRIFWGLSILTPVLAAFSAVGVGNVLGAH
jgi:hypothetical protein